jgi:site-specific DNA-adenine methylase
MGLFDSNLIIISMQNRDLVASTIALENDILLLATRWQQLSQQVTDRKDLMRKLREQEIKISQSTYCIVSGVSVKKNPQEVYPAL